MGGTLSAAKQPSVTSLFAGLVADDVIAAYGKLLTSGGVPKEQAAGFLGGALVDALRDLGMARVVASTPARPASFQAAPVALALQAVLADLQATVLKHHQLLLEGQHRLSEAQAIPGPTLDLLPKHQVEYIADREEIVRMSGHLINLAHHDWMTLETPWTDLPLSEDNLITCPKGLREKVRIRSIYDAETLRVPGALRNLQAGVAAGEEARILPRVTMKMQLADEAAVMLPLTSTGTGGALLIYAAPITSAMHHYFELQWELGQPVASAGQQHGEEIDDLQRQILQLMAAGCSDDSIASHLDKSKSTIRRNIEAIIKLTETDGRFALGLAVERRGWLSPRSKDAAGLQLVHPGPATAAGAVPVRGRHHGRLRQRRVRPVQPVDAASRGRPGAAADLLRQPVGPPAGLGTRRYPPGVHRGHLRG
jgi:DNA-binding CsgD family transcriptional regulator